jgi:hypothetical protein
MNRPMFLEELPNFFFGCGEGKVSNIKLLSQDYVLRNRPRQRTVG